MDGPQPRKITRNREFRACSECRKRKLRCDRQSPCTSCVRRNDVESCFYSKNPDDLQRERKCRLQAEARLEHLEKLVQELSAMRDVPSDAGRLINGTTPQQPKCNGIPLESMHNGATHWSAMLDDIDELRAAIREQDDLEEADSKLKGYNTVECDAASILFGSSLPLSFEQVLLQFLPPRHKADRLIGAYFRTKAVAAPFIHTGQFRRLYGRFWENPSAASPLWASLLFSILEIASKTLCPFQAAIGDEMRMPEQFDAAAAYCLAVGEYHRPQRFAVEALLLYIQMRCFASIDIGPDIAVLFGTLARLTTVMGYHRDPDCTQHKFTVFEGEMRRRTWSLYMQLDMLISFQLGLPTNTQFPTWDTRPPTNLLDADFDEESVTLPPPRPTTEPTELLFYIAKHQLMAVFEKVMRHTLSATEPPIDELEGLDSEIRSTFESLPAAFHPQSMSDSVVDSPSVKVARLCVCYIYHKCLCVLHRKHVTRGNITSLQKCYTAASDLVGQFLDMYREFEPGGQLETERWFMGSLTWHDFLLGCMALCLTLCYAKQHAADSNIATIVDVNHVLALLQGTVAAFEAQSKGSKDTRKVRRLVEVTITKFSGQGNEEATDSQNLLPSGYDHGAMAAMPSTLAGGDWFLDEGAMNLADDAGWAYLERFLYLPGEDLMIDDQQGCQK